MAVNRRGRNGGSWQVRCMDVPRTSNVMPGLEQRGECCVAVNRRGRNGGSWQVHCMERVENLEREAGPWTERGECRVAVNRRGHGCGSNLILPSVPRSMRGLDVNLMG